MKDFKTIQKETRDRRINAIFDSGDFSKEQLEVAKEFSNHLIRAGAKDETRRHYLTNLKHIAKSIGKPFKNITQKDLEDYVVSLKEYADKTQRDKKIFLKSVFFRWLYNKTRDDKLELIDWIKISRKDTNMKLPEEILTQDEVKKMVQVAKTLRDKAIIFALYESGCRKGEFLGLKIKHLNLDDYGAVIRVHGKTGSRTIRLIDSVHEIITWLNSHPDRENPEAPLWITEGAWLGRPLGEDGLKRVLKITAERAKVKKRMYPHLFRHSRATHLAKDLTEQEMKLFFGWTPGSNMTSVYVHLSGKDVENKLLAMHGLLEEQKKEKDKLKKKVCVECHSENSAANRWCGVCRAPLDDEDRLEAIKIENKVLDKAIKNNKPVSKELVMEVVKAIQMMKDEELEL